MFNLEQSITTWRKQMLAAGIKTPVPLEELEIHLREEIERQMKSGLSGQKAFEVSIQQIGQPKALDREFKKGEGTFMKRTAKIGMGVAGMLLGAVLTVPGSIQLRDELVMASGKLGLWLLGGFLLCWSGALFQQILFSKKTGDEHQNPGAMPARQPVKTIAGIVVLMVGVAFVMPAATQVWQKGLVEFAALGCMVFGIALLIAGSLVTFWPYTRRKA